MARNEYSIKLYQNILIKYRLWSIYVLRNVFKDFVLCNSFDFLHENGKVFVNKTIENISNFKT